jgi:predicted TPR repeat methyltransferase
VQSLSTLFLSSGDLIADRRFEWARAAERKGDLAGAADLLAQALELVPAYASAWFALGEVREKAGDRAGAIEAYRRARAADPDDRHGAALTLIRLGALAAAPMPPAYVRALFDHYAPDFDRALLQGLNYRAPQLLHDAVARAAGDTRHASVLDLGCGTGLAGAVFRPLADALVGVDLSPGMLAEADKRGIYDRLQAEDILSFLRAEAAAGRTHALIVAADVFAYFPDLAPVLAASAPALAPSGLLAFTVERHDGAGVALNASLRYAHGDEHVRAALAAAGLRPHLLEPASTRTEKGIPVAGSVVVAGRS